MALAAKYYKRLRVRGDFLWSFQEKVGHRPETITLREVRAWEGSHTNKEGFRSRREGRSNPLLPENVKGRFGTVLCSPTWLIEGESGAQHRISEGVYKLPWADLDALCAAIAAKRTPEREEAKELQTA